METRAADISKKKEGSPLLITIETAEPPPAGQATPVQTPPPPLEREISPSEDPLQTPPPPLSRGSTPQDETLDAPASSVAPETSPSIIDRDEKKKEEKAAPSSLIYSSKKPFKTDTENGVRQMWQWKNPADDEVENMSKACYAVARAFLLTETGKTPPNESASQELTFHLERIKTSNNSFITFSIFNKNTKYIHTFQCSATTATTTSDSTKTTMTVPATTGRPGSPPP